MNKIQYRVIRSKRKTIAIQITPDGTVLVRCPMRTSAAEVDAFVESKRRWIEKHLQKQALQTQLPDITEEEIQVMTRQAREEFPQRVAVFAPQVGVTYGRITIRHQKTRWGSCSGKGNLNFNCLLMLAPPEVRDYVVVHELCHRKQMNHSQSFWEEVEKILPNYKTHRKWLKENGTALIRRINNKE